MKNFVYENSKKTIVLGVTASENPADVKKIVPDGTPFYFYTDPTTIQSLLNNKKYDGIGTSTEETYAPTEYEEATSEIALLKHNLSETDYIACKIAEGSSTKEDYAGQITLRQQWRERIDELEQVVEKK